jgi:hypothetical protein
MKATRTVYAATVPALLPICKAAGLMRADIWRRYGALGTHGQTTAHDIRKDFAALYGHLPIDGTIRNETAKDAINAIFTYRAAAAAKVEQAIFRRTKDEIERKRLYTLLKRGEWLNDPFLHRQMRKHFRHGVSMSTQPIHRKSTHRPSCWKARGSVTDFTTPVGMYRLSMSTLPGTSRTGCVILKSHGTCRTSRSSAFCFHVPPAQLSVNRVELGSKQFGRQPTADKPSA